MSIALPPPEDADAIERAIAERGRAARQLKRDLDDATATPGSELERDTLYRDNQARVRDLEGEVAELREGLQTAQSSSSDEFVDARGWRPD